MMFTTFSELRKNLRQYVDHVTKYNTSVHISRPNNKGIVILSYRSYRSLTETHHLLQHPTNKKRLEDTLIGLTFRCNSTRRTVLLHHHYAHNIPLTTLTPIKITTQ